MIELIKSPDAYQLRDGLCELSFRLVGDRWQHALTVRQGDAWRPLLVSDEGQPGDESLRTPVFQDLRCEEPGVGIVEYQLMGQSGPGVYSGAVRYSAADRTLDFDLCGRARSGTVGLCTFTTYRMDERARAIDNRRDCQHEIPLTPNPSPAGGEGNKILGTGGSLESCAISNLEGNAAVLSLEGIPLLRVKPVPIAGSPASECWFSGEEGPSQLVVGCCESATPDSHQKPANIRWRYRITVIEQP
ncbi:MAG: hypothetical protein HY290_00475 [Planctomycetia bacterium]|nr:hypothetical protein [Planctomycetia bacterium]